MSYKLHGALLSPYVRKCRVFLAEKQIPYEPVHVDPGNLPADYADINPLKRIPALEHGDLSLGDSAVICQYLERLHPQTPLYPQDPADYARALWLEKYADYELGPLCTFGVFRQRLILPIRGLQGDENKAQQALEKLPAYFDYLEAQLQGSDWLVGDRLSIADIAVASQLVNMAHGGEPLDGSRWPALDAHRQRLHERPSFADSLAQETVIVGKIRSKLGLD